MNRDSIVQHIYKLRKKFAEKKPKKMEGNWDKGWGGGSLLAGVMGGLGGYLICSLRTVHTRQDWQFRVRQQNDS